MVLRTRRDTAPPWLAALLLLAGCARGATPRGLAHGCHLLDMKSDWNVVFPFELRQ